VSVTVLRLIAHVDPERIGERRSERNALVD
jgi:hypothetical protein